MRLVNLKLHLKAIPILAHWHYQEWHHLFPERSEQDFAHELTECLHPESSQVQAQLPQTWVLVSDAGEVCGSVSLLLADMTTNHDLGPWLANVFIAPAYRGQGLGQKIVKAAMQQAFALKLERLYLFTPDQQAFYQRLGWHVHKQEFYEGEWVTLMTWQVCSIAADLLANK